MIVFIYFESCKAFRGRDSKSKVGLDCGQTKLSGCTTCPKTPLSEFSLSQKLDSGSLSFTYTWEMNFAPLHLEIEAFLKFTVYKFYKCRTNVFSFKAHEKFMLMLKT